MTRLSAAVKTDEEKKEIKAIALLIHHFVVPLPRWGRLSMRPALSKIGFPFGEAVGVAD